MQFSPLFKAAVINVSILTLDQIAAGYLKGMNPQKNYHLALQFQLAVWGHFSIFFLFAVLIGKVLILSLATFPIIAGSYF